MEEIMTAEEAIKKKVELEFKMRDFTKYINRTLREDMGGTVEDWSFAVNTMGENTLEVTIDYPHNFHSRDVYDLERYDLDSLRRTFNHYLLKHQNEYYNSRIKPWSMYEGGE